MFCLHLDVVGFISANSLQLSEMPDRVMPDRKAHPGTGPVLWGPIASKPDMSHNPCNADYMVCHVCNFDNPPTSKCATLATL
eukprot:scaffold309242_cov33-Prasinocladus_malaysianus.AAC.1